MDMVLKISMTLIGVISLSFLDSDKWKQSTEAYLELKKAREKDYDEYWDSLSYEDQLKAFYSVVKRIHKAEIEDKGTYRWALYDVFEFGPEAYVIGMECGYMNIHNAIIA
jgi:hypothetical protein